MALRLPKGLLKRFIFRRDSNIWQAQAVVGPKRSANERSETFLASVERVKFI